MCHSIQILKVLEDNFVYSIRNDAKSSVVVIDAGDAEAILKGIRGESLEAVLLTHHHWDHTCGAQQLKQQTGCKLLGAQDDKHRLPVLDSYVREGSRLTILGNLPVEVLDISGHTGGHIGFYIAKLSAVFVGDLLFTLGCGRIFEGDAERFFRSLQKIKALPADTRIYGGHEYTKVNIAFTKFAIKNLNANAPFMKNLDVHGLHLYMEKLEALLANKRPTVPVTVKDECRYNLFLRAETASEFAEIRALKDAF